MFSAIILAAMMSQVPQPSQPPQSPDQAAQFASLLNYQRQIRGLGLVGVDANANYVAYQNNIQQLVHGLGHWVLNGLSQCAAVGQPDINTVLNAWINSPAHAAILFDPNLVNIGFCGASGAWTMSGVVGYTQAYQAYQTYQTYIQPFYQSFYQSYYQPYQTYHYYTR